MKTAVTKYDFVNAFDEMGRGDNFSREGRFALYECLTELEELCGEELKLDIIAICCQFTEYESLEEVKESYNSENLNIVTLDDLRDYTPVIEIKGTKRLLVQDF